MSAVPAEEQLLPTPDQIELANYLIGSYLSDLDCIKSRVKREVSSTVSLDEYRRLSEADALDLLSPDLDRDDLNRLLLFAADALQDAENIREQATEIMNAVLGQLHQLDEPGRSPAAWRAYEERITTYHRQQAKRWRRR